MHRPSARTGSGRTPWVWVLRAAMQQPKQELPAPIVPLTTSGAPCQVQLELLLVLLTTRVLGAAALSAWSELLQVLPMSFSRPIPLHLPAPGLTISRRPLELATTVLALRGGWAARHQQHLQCLQQVLAWSSVPYQMQKVSILSLDQQQQPKVALKMSPRRLLCWMLDCRTGHELEVSILRTKLEHLARHGDGC